MKFEDLKELGSESAVKVCVPFPMTLPFKCVSSCDLRKKPINCMRTGCWKIQAGREDLCGAGRGHYLL
jgi:hypothetical protein